MTSTPPRHRSRSAAVLALLVALVAACGQAAPSQSASPTATPSPSPSQAPATSAAPSVGPSVGPSSSAGAAIACAAAAPSDAPSAAPPVEASPDANDPNAARYAEIEGQVSQIRGLTLDSPVQRSTFDRAGLGEFIQESFNKDNPEALIDGSERLLKGLLLMPQDQSLRDLYIEMLTSQVAGLYDDTTRRMYVVTETGEIGPSEEITYAHEYTHALQDQAFDLSKIKGTATDQGDRGLARTALIEGDATLLMSIWAQQHLTQAELLEAVGAGDPASQAALDKLPAILKETLLFPYTDGLQMLLGPFLSRGSFAAADALFANPPESTEQVLHPEKLTAREAPIAVAFPDDLAGRLGDGWCVALQDTFGEFQLRILLADAAGAASAAEGAAAGWGGDRVALIDGPDGATGVVLDTRWDTDADAAEYATALAGIVPKLQAAGRSAQVLTPEPNRVVLISANSDDTLGRLANVLGLAG
jgi:hypothetical protein